MRIALDCMGGDVGLPVNIKGAVSAAGEQKDIEIILVGRGTDISKKLAGYDTGNLNLSIEDVPEVVKMSESPSSVIRKKKDSSILRSIRLVKEGRAEAAVTAGNSGAAMALAMTELGAIPSIERPAIAVSMPGIREDYILLDAGASVDCKAKHLLQFAIMGSIYAEFFLGRSTPRVGLLNIGEEESKGNELTKGAYRLLRESFFNFIGNVEGRDIFNGRLDVVVCDGFIGNIVLKSIEGISAALEVWLKDDGAALSKFRSRMDYAERGGAPLLGINGVCFISHGRSSPRAIANALTNAGKFVSADVNGHLRQAMEKNAR